MVRLHHPNGIGITELEVLFHELPVPYTFGYGSASGPFAAFTTRRESSVRGTDQGGLRYRPGRELELTFNYTYRVEDFGRLIREDRWVEILSWDKTYQNFDVSVAYPLFSSLMIIPNLGYSHRREYEHYQGGRHFKSRLISKRIGLRGRYRLRHDNGITFSASRSVENATDIPERTFDRLQLTIQQIF